MLACDYALVLPIPTHPHQSIPSLTNATSGRAEVERCAEPGVRWLERGMDTVGRCSVIRRIMAWGERKRQGRWGGEVEMERLK